jgi:hypothetical protein
MNEDDLDWLLQRKGLVVKTAIDNWRCRCGSRLKVQDRWPKIEAVCLARRPWNFWRHDPPRTILRY